MPSVGTGRFGDFARRYLGIDGDPPIAREVVPDLNLTIELGAQPDFAFLQQERLCSGRVIGQVVVGGTPEGIFINPGDSGALAVIEAVHVLTGGNGIPSWGIGAGGVFTDNPAVGLAGYRDQRWGRIGVSSPICEVLGGVRAGGTYSIIGTLDCVGASAAPQNSWVLPHPVIVPPGVSISVFLNLTNTSAQFSFVWRERPALPTEF